MSDQPARFYGTDLTDEFDTVAEATRMDDGTIHIDVVVMDLMGGGGA